MAHEIRIPTGKKSSSGNSGGIVGGTKETNKLLKKLDKSVIATIDIWEIATSLISDLNKILQPLFKVLSLLFMVVFLPLMPLIVKLTESITSIIDGLIKVFGGEMSMKDFLTSVLGPALLEIGIGLLQVIGKLLFGIVVLVGSLLGLALDRLKALFSLIWDGLKFGFMFIIQIIISAASWLWNSIVSGFQFILTIGQKIWEFFMSGLGFIADLGQKIWNFIWDGLKNVGSLIANGFKAVMNGIIDFANSFLPGFAEIPHLAQGGIVTKPTTALIGEAGPEAVIPLSKMGGMGTTININNPTIRDDRDIRKMTDQISRALQKRGNRGFSSI